MNWVRGLFRTWVFGSMLWILAVGYHAYSHREEFVPPSLGPIAQAQNACADARKANPKLGNPFDCFDRKAVSDCSGTNRGPWCDYVDDWVYPNKSGGFDQTTATPVFDPTQPYTAENPERLSILEYVLWALGLPAILLLSAIAVRWIIKGFRREALS